MFNMASYIYQNTDGIVLWINLNLISFTSSEVLPDKNLPHVHSPLL